MCLLSGAHTGRERAGVNAGLAFSIGLVKALRSVHDEVFQGVGSFVVLTVSIILPQEEIPALPHVSVTWELEATEAVACETWRKDSGAQ